VRLPGSPCSLALPSITGRKEVSTQAQSEGYRGVVQSSAVHRPSLLQEEVRGYRTLRAFSSKLREETDLDRLGGELVSVLRETMQPEHASLWLRPPGRREPHESEVKHV
jgi:hypothetical protein